jgi:predicted phosphoribosyltransferase
VERIAAKVDGIYCANIRTGLRFAVADAYERWYDVTEEEVREQLKNLRQGHLR